MAGYIGSKAVITSGVSASIDELNIIDGVTATTAELNILDGVTSTAAELNILDGVTSTAAELNILDGVTATATELNLIDGVTATTAELNILDGVTATAAEINLIDGGTARGTTTIVDADGVLVNDAGTMRQTTMATLATYMGTKGLGSTFTTAANGSAPSSPAVGDFWYNSTYGQLLIYMSKDGSNNFWHTFVDSFGGFQNIALMNAPGLGYSIYINFTNRLVDRVISLAVPGESATFWAAGHTLHDHSSGSRGTGLSNAVRGVFIGGYNNDKDMGYMTLAVNSTETADFGDLSGSIGATFCTGANHATRGVISAGRSTLSDATTASNIMEYITIGTAGNSTDFGNLVSAKSNTTAVESEVRAIFAGGLLDSNSTDTNEMDYVTVASTGNATDFGNLTSAIQGSSSATNGTRGVFCGGDSSARADLAASSDGTAVDIMDYITLGSAGNATDFGNLQNATSPHAGTSTGVKGIVDENLFTIATAANATLIPSFVDYGLGTRRVDVLMFDGWISATG